MRRESVDPRSGADIPVVATGRERNRFVRYCNRERVRCGLVRVDGTGCVVEHPAIEAGC